MATCELAVMDRTGDSKTTWDPENEDEVAAARKVFKSLRRKGYLAFRVRRNGEAGEAISEFDPEAGKLIMTPPMAGG